MLPTIWLYLDKLGQQHSDKLGHIFVEQLAEQARQPMLYKDKISLQVLVNRIVSNSDDVIKAAIFDIDNALQVQSSHAQNNNQDRDDAQSSVYRYQIKLENSSAGLAQLSIDSAGIKSNLQALFWSVALIWILLSALLCIGLTFVGGNLARRLTRIIGGLPSRQDPENANEIDHLEASIKPLLVKPEISDDDHHQSPGSLTLTICCENIQRLKAQLSQQNYQRLLKSFDAASDCAIKLFDGTRSPGSQHCIHLNFSCDGGQHNALLRAISCYLGITNVLRSSAPRFGSGLTLRSAIALMGTSPAHSQFERDQQRENDLQQLIKTTALAGSWQLLIPAALIKEVRTDPRTRTQEAESAEPKTALEQAFSYEAFFYKEAYQETNKEFVPGANSETDSKTNSESRPKPEPYPRPDSDKLVVFKAMNPEYQDILAGQLAYLRSQLPTQVTGS
ncbi:MAG: hypothetical protein KUG71_04885 [Porticoccaceae bacterium]|nr:hypothetical protein [Porticoccaceae bacterium]